MVVEPNNSSSGAKIGAAIAAQGANQTPLNPDYHYPVAGVETLDRWPDSHNGSCELMAEDYRRPHPFIAGLGTVGVKVAAANAARSHLYHYLSRTWLGRGDLLDGSCVRLFPVLNECFHFGHYFPR
jgi:hypothetical protein